MQIVTVALEDAMFLQVDLHIKVAWRAAIYTWFAIAGGTDAHAVIDPCGNLHLQRLVAANSPNAIAGGAGVRNFLTGSVTCRAVLLHTEETLLHPHYAGAVTGMTGAWLRTRLGTAAMTDITCFPARNADLGIETVSRLFQRDVQGVLKIGTAINLRPAPATTAAEDFSKDVAEGICETACTAHTCTHP